MKKVPMRTCVVTKEIKPKKELIRICATKDKVVSIDLTGKAPGRGAYIHLSKAVILKAQKTKALDKKLEATVPDQIYEDLLKLV
ncbi:MAG: YlxR family protein [Acholeplasmataceae bacterium]